MHNANFRSDARETSANLHQTTCVAGNDGVHLRAFNRLNLLIEDGSRNFRILDRERSTETTTGVGVFQLDKFGFAHALNQPTRLAMNIEITQTVTRVMPGHSSRETSAYVVY